MGINNFIPAVIGWTERATPPTIVDKIIITAVYLAKQVTARKVRGKKAQ